MAMDTIYEQHRSYLYHQASTMATTQWPQCDQTLPLYLTMPTSVSRNLDNRLGSSTQVLTGAADNTARLWDCETGRELFKFETNSAVRTCCFSYSGKLFTYSTDMAMKSKCEIVLYDVRALESPIR